MQPHDLVMYVAKQILYSILVITLKKGSYHIATIVAITGYINLILSLHSVVLLNMILYKL